MKILTNASRNQASFVCVCSFFFFWGGGGGLSKSKGLGSTGLINFTGLNRLCRAYSFNSHIKDLYGFRALRPPKPNLSRVCRV